MLLPAGTVPAAAELPPPDDRPLAASFRDFVALEREALASAACRLYWERRMDGGGGGRLPPGPVARRRAPDPAQPLVGRLDTRIPDEVSDGLWAAARAASAPLKNLLLAAHLKALSFLTGGSDVVSGVLANGRPEGADGDRVIGGFLNAMPFRVDLAPGSWLALARQVFDAERELLAYRRFPLSELRRSQPGAGRPLFDTLFNFTHFHVYDRLARFPGMTVLGGGGTEQTYFPLTAQLNVHELTHRVTLSFDHPHADLDTREVEAIAARYLRILEAVAADPGAPHDALCLLDARERQQILIEWNTGWSTEWSATPTPPGPPGEPPAAHERFADQAALTPEAPALLWGEEAVTYGELAARAGRVARRLLALGLPAEARVAILLDRSPDLVVAILGALQAGAAYVPLDPDYPRERLDAMLGDSGARALVTRRGLGETGSRDGAGKAVSRIDLEDLAGPAPALPAGLPRVDPAQLFAGDLHLRLHRDAPRGSRWSTGASAAFLAGAAVLDPPEAEDRRAGGSASRLLRPLHLRAVRSRSPTAAPPSLAGSALDLPRLAGRDAVAAGGVRPLRRGGAAAERRAFPPACARWSWAARPSRRALARTLRWRPRGAACFNAYGPTEATDLRHPGPDRRRGGRGAAPSAGRPLAGAGPYVLDAAPAAGACRACRGSSASAAAGSPAATSAGRT